MDLGISNKVALITGSTTGLGFACAQMLLAEGAKVAISSRSQNNADIAAEKLRADAKHDHVYAEAVDYTDSAAMDTYLATIEEKFGIVDILVCSSGGPPLGTATQYEVNDYAAAINNNLLSLMRLTTKVLPKMQARQWGRIVYITSSAAVQPIPNLALSNVARSGLHAYAKTLAAEVAKDGVTVNCVMPGRINTDRIMHLVRDRAEKSDSSLQAIMQQDFATIPAGRYGQPKELANAVAFLCSDAASYITGSAIAVDGGAIAGLR